MKRTFKCNCGGTIETGKSWIEGFLLDANICNKCGEVGFPIESAKELLRLKEAGNNQSK